MIVVADTSPLNYLVLIGEIDILPKLYVRVLIPPAVLAELNHRGTPIAVREWISATPHWLEVRQPKEPLRLPQLDPGETEAIALAAELAADVILIDEMAGRREAERQGLLVAGTLSVLDDADRVGLLNFEEAITALQSTSFRVSRRVLEGIRRIRTAGP